MQPSRSERLTQLAARWFRAGGARWIAEVEAARLAGLVLPGLSDDAEARARLRAAAHQEAARHADHLRQATRVLDALAAAGVNAVWWKGEALAADWPTPALRPAGDVDLLVAPANLARALTALAPLGYAAPPPPRPRWSDRLRPPAPGVELWGAPGQVAVDLQTRPFRSVGERLAIAPLLARARLRHLAGARRLTLHPADALLLVAVHAAKHALRAPHWLLDVVLLMTAADDATWADAEAQAGQAGVRRAFGLATALAETLLARHGGDAWPRRHPRTPHRLAAAWFDLDATRTRRALGAVDRYALELLLEERLRPRLARAAGALLARL